MIETVLAWIEEVPYLLEIIYSIFIIIIAYLVNKIVITRWATRAAKKANVKKHVLKPLQNLLHAVVYVIAILLILRVFGIQGALTSLLAGAGFAGIVVGFATKDIIGNFISGIILIIDKDFKVGDIVEIENIMGIVEDIEIRTTVVKTWDGETVIIPNSKVANEVIKNRSIDQPEVRIRLPIGVRYSSDMEKVIKVCDKVMANIEEIKEDPKPQVIFEEFGDSSINFELRFWINFEEISPPDIKTKVSVALKKELDKKGIGIPFPNVEVIMKK